jgi:hypothetical protein
LCTILPFSLVADAEDLVERLAVGKLDDGVVELAAADEVEAEHSLSALVRVGGHRRSDEGNLDGRIGGLDGFGEALVAAGQPTVEVKSTRNS